jgi:NRAMP (natural resistance-associated macrophage protein)-like metal ion transporter
MTDHAFPLPAPSRLQQLRSRGRVRETLAVLGPAFVACIAYVDPGNFATNIAGGAKYGYLLLWVLLSANLMAMLIQNLSAKIGIATGRNLPELCREHFPRPVSWALWVQAELIAMATDLAEFVGAAIALNLLFGVPLFHAGVITAIVAFGILALQAKGHRRFEAVIAGLLGLIILGFLYDTLRIGFDAGGAAKGFIPGFAGTDSVLLATGILGATVMPHVIYLHSALTQNRIPAEDDGERHRLLRFQRVDITIAMGLAGLVNMSMLVIAASLFHDRGLLGLDSIEEAHTQFGALAGGSHLRGPGRHAGLHRAHDPARPAPAGDDDPGPDRARDRAGPVALAGHLAGHPQLRDPIRARAARAADAPARHHGRAGQPPADDAGGSGGRGAHHRPQRLPARRHLVRVASAGGMTFRHTECRPKT